MKQSVIPSICLALAPVAGLVAQQSVTVPANYAMADAPSRLWLAGVSSTFRQQIVIDPVHLVAAQGHSITALLFRREAANEAYLGSTANLTIRLAESQTIDSMSASPVFATNLGANSVTAFAGTATIPQAPPMDALSIGWGPNQSIRIDFSQPFAYSGGSLVIDIVGTAPSQPVAWWPLDAVRDQAAGTVQNVGTACGIRAAQGSGWASAAESTLVPGGSSLFYAHGTENGLALMFLGLPPANTGIPLQALIPTVDPSCQIYIPFPLTVMPTTFSIVPHAGQGGIAQVWLQIPNATFVLGATLGSQWMDVQQNFATSNGVAATFSSTVPSLGVCTIEGAAGAARGFVSTSIAHVMRLEFQ